MLPSAQCSRYAVLPYDSTLSIEGRSSLHPIGGRATRLAGYLEANVGDDGRLSVDPLPSLHVAVPVDQLRSGNDLQDREMRRLAGSRAHPNITAELRSLRWLEGGRYAASGDISLNGRTERHDGELDIAVDGPRITIDGSLMLDVRRFGIEPPRILMLRVFPELSVRLHLVATKAA